jgi:hypothetical protein
MDPVCGAAEATEARVCGGTQATGISVRSSCAGQRLWLGLSCLAGP